MLERDATVNPLAVIAVPGGLDGREGGGPEILEKLRGRRDLRQNPPQSQQRAAASLVASVPGAHDAAARSYRFLGAPRAA